MGLRNFAFSFKNTANYFKKKKKKTKGKFENTLKPKSEKTKNFPVRSH